MYDGVIHFHGCAILVGSGRRKDVIGLLYLFLGSSVTLFLVAISTCIKYTFKACVVEHFIDDYIKKNPDVS